MRIGSGGLDSKDKSSNEAPSYENENNELKKLH